MDKNETDIVTIKPVAESELPPEIKDFESKFGLEPYQVKIMFAGFLAHGLGLYYFLYLLPFGHVSAWNFAYWILVAYASGIGITVGAHRYWTHRTFKSKLPLQILLMVLQTLSSQYPIYHWCRMLPVYFPKFLKDHRVHHKYTDTNADPYNSKRGIWFSHILWLFQPYHPEVKEKFSTVDMSDLANDPVVKFQCKYYYKLILLICFAMPMTINHLLFPEMSLFHNFCGAMTRAFFLLHGTFLINSWGHAWGWKPYDKDITPVDNVLLSFITLGEGWHNYHHTFPWDYKASESAIKVNLSALFIQFFARIGWAYDLKTVSHKLLMDRIIRTGDGTHPLHGNREITKTGAENKDVVDSNWSTNCWGWGDEQLPKEDLDVTETMFPVKDR